jgi:hypothetical protein
VACFVIAPARLARAGAIGLTPTPGGFGTPPLPDGTSIEVRGSELVDGDRVTPLTTLRDAAAFVAIELSATTDVGRDLPPFEPDAALVVDTAAARELADWFARGANALVRVDAGDGTASAATLWPEHFDVAITIELPAGAGATIGFSPGDDTSDEPYAYVAPWDRSGLAGPFWNAPFGALRTRHDVGTDAAVDAFLAEGIALVRSRQRS